MKQTIYHFVSLPILLVMAVCLSIGCGPAEQPEPTPTPTPTPTTVAVTGVTLNKATLTLVEGSAETLAASVSPDNASNKSVSWKSSATDIATVDGSGKVTAVKAGSATITVTTADGGKTATCSVTVTEQAKIVITGNTAKVPVSGGTAEFPIQYNTSYTIEIESSAQSWLHFVETRAMQSGTLVFSVDANKGEARTGKATVKDNDGKVEPITLTFEQEPYIAVTSVQLSPEAAELEVGETLALTVTVLPENATDKTVTWSTDNASVATVTEDGTVTTVAQGTATITAAAGEAKASCVITVIPSAYETERAALEAFYRANNGDKWTHRDNWCTDAPLVEWYGVGMSNDEKHVTGLGLWNNGVIGYIPKEIGNLTELESLGISCTPEETYGLPMSLFGPLPEEIGELKKLTYLYLQDYPLTGKLPEGLFSLPELETLGIIRPLYTEGTLSPSIGNLTSLRSLALANVNLTGSLPAELGRLNKLVYANLELNRFSGTIPSSLAGLVNLEHLSLLNNKLSGPLPATLANIPRFPLMWGELVELNLFSQEDIRASKIPAPTSPKVKTLSGQDLDIDSLIKSNKYVVLFNVAPEYGAATEYLTRLENLYKKGKDKGLAVLTYFDNNSTDEQVSLSRDNMFKDILNKSGAEWDSFIRYMYGDYPDGAPFYASKGDLMYPCGRINQIVIIGPDGTVDYTTLIDWDLENDVEHALDYLEQVFDISTTYYESQSYSRDGIVTQLQKATSGKGVDLVITGDAFSDRNLTDGIFVKAAKQAIDDFFSVEPLKSLKDRFNVYMVEAVSKNEDYFSGSSTVFSGVFGSGSAVGGDNGKVLEYAKKAVKDDARMDNAIVLVLMNSYRDGGTCYLLDPADESQYAGGTSVAWVTYKDVSVSGGLSNLSSTIVHEVGGHGLGKLADEYAYLFMGEVNAAEAAYIRDVQKWNWYRNISLTPTLSELPWSRYIGDSAFASENIGAYQGGDSYWSGVWRPTEQSVMNDNYNHFTFNAPSRAQIYTRIMKLSEGQDWQFDYEEFVKWDQAHPTKMSAAPATRSNYVEVDDAEDAGHVPPVILNKTWRQMIRR